MAVKDYYTILGVAPQATTTELRRAYRALARKYHPDTNNSDAYALARFMEVKEAYEVLTNPARRQLYLQERWMAAYHAQALDAGGPITPERVLKQLLLYEKQLLAQDVYRMNKEAMAQGAEALLNTEVMEALLRFNDAAANQQMVLAGLRILRYLPYPSTAGLAQSLLALADNDAGLCSLVTAARRQQQKQHSWNRYYWVVVLAATLLLLAFIWVFTRP